MPVVNISLQEFKNTVCIIIVFIPSISSVKSQSLQVFVQLPHQIIQRPQLKDIGASINENFLPSFSLQQFISTVQYDLAIFLFTNLITCIIKNADGNVKLEESFCCVENKVALYEFLLQEQLIFYCWKLKGDSLESDSLWFLVRCRMNHNLANYKVAMVLLYMVVSCDIQKINMRIKVGF